MKKLDVYFKRDPNDSFLVGRLAEDRGVVYFEYAREFIARGLNLSPLRLPFAEGLFKHTDRNFGPLPGLFDDSLPDGWGLLLMDRHFQKKGLVGAQTSPLARLAWLSTRTMGALTYHPPEAREYIDPHISSLHALAEHSQKIISGEARDVLPLLLQSGGSPGGARPKVLIGVCKNKMLSGADDLPEGFEHWIVKFFAGNDPKDSGAVEYAYSLMARAAGIAMPETRIFETKEGGQFFGVRRFDRDGNRRFHVHTFGNLIQSNFRIPSCDYADLLKVTSLLTRNQGDVLQVFRRMVFNVLAHNRDDHVKNFAFMMNDMTGEWALAPAYDLTRADGPGGEHALTIAGEGKTPGSEHFLELARIASVTPKVAKEVIDEVISAVSGWTRIAKRVGVRARRAKGILP